jgi:hypothetical protein
LSALRCQYIVHKILSTGSHRSERLSEACARSAAVAGSTDWKPTVEVHWTGGRFYQMKRWMASEFDGVFATEKLAEIEAHIFARQWIDAHGADWKLRRL